MAPFGLTLRAGLSIFDQLVSAAQKAIVSGEISPGQAFPSVRGLAAELKIHPNTAQKAVQYLIHERWLEVRPGIGTVVAPVARGRAEDRRQLIEDEIRKMVSEARRVGLEMEEFLGAVRAEWTRHEAAREVGA